MVRHHNFLFSPSIHCQEIDSNNPALEHYSLDLETARAFGVCSEVGAGLLNGSLWLTCHSSEGRNQLLSIASLDRVGPHQIAGFFCPFIGPPLMSDSGDMVFCCRPRRGRGSRQRASPKSQSWIIGTLTSPLVEISVQALAAVRPTTKSVPRHAHNTLAWKLNVLESKIGFTRTDHVPSARRYSALGPAERRALRARCTHYCITLQTALASKSHGVRMNPIFVNLQNSYTWATQSDGASGVAN